MATGQSYQEIELEQLFFERGWWGGERGRGRLHTITILKDFKWF